MGSEQTAPTGPDLTRGVPAVEIAEGRMVAGHVDGEAALLVRRAGELYAIGARCTHYGGPLDEGLLTEGIVRCPWHHAAFDVTTGACARPPALFDLPCWNVEVRDGMAVVTSKRDAPVRAERRDLSRAPESVVIIGGGAATAVALGTLRSEGYEGPITVVSAERTPLVDRPNLSKDYLAGSAPDEWIPLHPDSWYAEQNITLHAGTEVSQIELAARRVQLADGRTIPFDALLIATGASPIRLPLGDGAPVSYLRSLDDSNVIIEKAKGARTAVVLGASFIGLEVAASLRARDLEVTVVAPESQPLERVLGEQLGRVVRDLHEARGVRFRLGRLAKGADASGVVLDDGTRVDADLIVAGVGVRPNVALAEAAGLAVDNGIVVNEYLETSTPGVYAAGDVARWPDPHSGQSIRVEHWVLAERQGQTAALNMLGARERFDAVPFFWSMHYDVAIRYVGYADRPERIEIDGNPRAHDCTVRYHMNGRVAAVATIGRDRANLLAETEMERASRRLAVR